MEELLKTWETRMFAYRKEADESKSNIERIKAINKFFAYRDCINEIKQQLLINGVVNRRELLCDDCGKQSKYMAVLCKECYLKDSEL